MGFEPTTASLEGWNSTTELRPPDFFPHPAAHNSNFALNHTRLRLPDSTSLMWWAGKDSNLGSRWQQIYSLPPLATWVPARNTLHTTQQIQAQSIFIAFFFIRMMKNKSKPVRAQLPPPYELRMKVVSLGHSLFRNSWILLMKSGDVKTKKQNYLVFFSDTLHPPEFTSRILPSPLFFISAVLDSTVLGFAHFL